MDTVGYINMAVGIVGIVVSILTAPSLLDAISRARRNDGEDEFARLGRSLRLFAGILVLASFVFVLAMGIAITIRSVMAELGSSSPGVVGVLLAAALVSASLTLALRLGRSWYWVPGLVGTLGLCLSALVAGANGISQGLWLTISNSRLPS